MAHIHLIPTGAAATGEDVHVGNGDLHFHRYGNGLRTSADEYGAEHVHEVGSVVEDSVLLTSTPLPAELEND